MFTILLGGKYDTVTMVNSIRVGDHGLANGKLMKGFDGYVTHTVHSIIN